MLTIKELKKGIKSRISLYEEALLPSKIYRGPSCLRIVPTLVCGLTYVNFIAYMLYMFLITNFLIEYLPYRYFEIIVTYYTNVKRYVRYSHSRLLESSIEM